MGDGKKVSSRMGKISMRETLIWKSHVRKEVTTAHHWPSKYKWMVDMYGYGYVLDSFQDSGYNTTNYE